MGQWTVQSITATTTELNGTELFGSNFMVNIRMKYTANLLGMWVESPQLVWHEHFTTVDHNARTFWEFEHDMIELKPGSPTFQGWTMRYIQAYNNVVGNGHGLNKGANAFLRDTNDRAIGRTALGKTNLTDNIEKAKAVRSYLKSNGGILDMLVIDVPSMLISKINLDKHLERLLLFNCSVGDKHITAMQYIDFDQAHRPWKREFKISSFSRMTQDHHGFARVDTPTSVSGPNNAFGPGLYR